MAKYRPVKTSFWTDPYIQGLSVEEKLIFLYLITNPLTRLCGIYEISDRTIAFETGLSEKVVAQTVDRLYTDGKTVRHGSWIYIINYSKHQQNNPSVVSAIQREMLEIPQDIAKAIQTVDRLSQTTHKPILKLIPKPKPKPIRKEKKSTEVDSGVPEKPHGDKNINDMLLALKATIGIEDFADSVKWQRIYGKHCYQLATKITHTEFARRLDILLNDGFKRKRMNEIKYVYEQVKGFLEPNGGDSSPGVFIS